MKTRSLRPAAGCIAALALGCAAHPDHFYTLNTLPGKAGASSTAPALHVILDTTIPVLDDRGELLLSSDGNRIAVLDHERWAAPLSDLVQQTLARDIELRRADVLVADRRFDRPAAPPVTLKVDIVRMTAEPGRRASIEAHWRLVDGRTGIDKFGSAAFDAPLAAADAPIAHAYSEVLGELADALTAELPPP
jgi:uncharacterized lipoprotein YmbA